MRIREDAVVEAPPERAFELLADPARHHAWNTKIVETTSWSSGRPGLGHRYRVTYEMSGRRSEFDAEIVHFDAPHRWTARLEERMKGDGRNAARHMMESYTLQPGRGGRTHVRYEVHVRHSGIPLPLRALIWVIMRFGKPTGPTNLERFRTLVEGAERAKPAA